MGERRRVVLILILYLMHSDGIFGIQIYLRGVLFPGGHFQASDFLP